MKYEEGIYEPSSIRLEHQKELEDVESDIMEPEVTPPAPPKVPEPEPTPESKKKIPKKIRQIYNWDS